MLLIYVTFLSSIQIPVTYNGEVIYIEGTKNTIAGDVIYQVKDRKGTDWRLHFNEWR